MSLFPRQILAFLTSGPRRAFLTAFRPLRSSSRLPPQTLPGWRIALRQWISGIDVSQSPPDDQCLRENSADGCSVVESFLRDFLMNTGRNSDVNLTVEWPGHSKLQFVLYHYTMVYQPDLPPGLRTRAPQTANLCP